MKIKFRRSSGAEVKDFTFEICIILISGVPIHILSKHLPRLRPSILIPRVWIHPGSLEPVAQTQDYMLDRYFGVEVQTEEGMRRRDRFFPEAEVQTARGKGFGYDRGHRRGELSVLLLLLRLD